MLPSRDLPDDVTETNSRSRPGEKPVQELGNHKLGPRLSFPLHHELSESSYVAIKIHRNLRIIEGLANSRNFFDKVANHLQRNLSFGLSRNQFLQT